MSALYLPKRNSNANRIRERRLKVKLQPFGLVHLQMIIIWTHY